MSRFSLHLIAALLQFAMCVSIDDVVVRRSKSSVEATQVENDMSDDAHSFVRRQKPQRENVVMIEPSGHVKASQDPKQTGAAVQELCLAPQMNVKWTGAQMTADACFAAISTNGPFSDPKASCQGKSTKHFFWGKEGDKNCGCVDNNAKDTACGANNKGGGFGGKAGSWGVYFYKFDTPAAATPPPTMAAPIMVAQGVHELCNANGSAAPTPNVEWLGEDAPATPTNDFFAQRWPDALSCACAVQTTTDARCQAPAYSKTRFVWSKTGDKNCGCVVASVKDTDCGGSPWWMPPYASGVHLYKSAPPPLKACQVSALPPAELPPAELPTATLPPTLSPTLPPTTDSPTAPMPTAPPTDYVNMTRVCSMYDCAWWCLDGCHAHNKTYINSRAASLGEQPERTCTPAVAHLFRTVLCREPEKVACTYLAGHRDGTNVAKIETAIKHSSEYAKCDTCKTGCK